MLAIASTPSTTPLGVSAHIDGSLGVNRPGFGLPRGSRGRDT